MPVRISHGSYNRGSAAEYAFVRNRFDIPIHLPTKFIKQLERRKKLFIVPFTIAHDEDNKTMVITICSESDSFCRKIGRTIALQRMVFALEEADQDREWIYRGEIPAN